MSTAAARPGGGCARAGPATTTASTLLAVRVTLATGLLSPADARAVETYTSPVPLFASGTQAAEHGLADLDTPSPQAVQAIATFDRRRAAPAVQGEATTAPTPDTVQPIADPHRPAGRPRAERTRR
ncbi:DUF6283 family protein [Nonomuraea wenchangensis]|uniref:DUF6283 family protein n=1 Tax=Nonomuraea wenchangensis TaxID=568860 RepID=UPI003CCC0F8B